MDRRNLTVLAAFLITLCVAHAFAAPATGPTGILLFDNDNDDDDKPAAQTHASQSRYFFNLLDNRSSYGKEFFPDLFIGPEFDKDTQLELDYTHGENHGMQSNEIDAELDYNVIGQLTIAAEFGWESEHQPGDEDDPAQTESGFENVDLAAIHPIFQYVSPNNIFDYTAVARFDVSIPTRTPASTTDVQLTPYIGNLIRLDDHVSIEAWAGPQFTIAPNQTTQLIYGASLGYQLTQIFTPMFELDGQTPFFSHGQDALFGVAGFNVNLGIFSVGDAQPKFGVGYQFPIDQGARNQLRWGIITQVFLDF